MKQNKQMYLSPETEVLVVRFEESLLQGSNYGAKGAAGQNIEDGYEYDL